ncbi:MAG TPA: hypothetical protein P5519_08040 [Spirochaetia bacterium]|nr:hypothetical protein [Spirochaetales bacterium]HPD81220.1 hypothetical protein [Spirochaetales bacterium]HQK33222.1 hypothetical protein [Spirochaetales bacterium]HRS65827.1 hypothetical protein [Spirochaetia bacterium]HRV28593.1 hypothetical protein [Spirochaetia bacterium]
MKYRCQVSKKVFRLSKHAIKKYLCILAIFLTSYSVFAFDITHAGGSLGVLIINNTVPESAPNPVVNTIGGFANFTFTSVPGFAPGSSVPGFAPGFFLSTALDILWLNYENRDGIAVPTETETGNGNNVFVIGLLLDVPLGYVFYFGPPVTESLPHRFSATLLAGTSFLFRICMNGDTTEAYASVMEQNRIAVAQYLWGNGRWFYPMISGKFGIVLQETFTFTVGAKWYIPIFNLWTTDDNSFFNASMLAIQLAMQISL